MSLNNRDLVPEKQNSRRDETAADNACTSCGACCAAFRVSFYWAEADDNAAGGVPVNLTVQLNAFRRAMRLANDKDLRCIALRGTPGRKVRCAIYERRPSVCRNFEPCWKAGVDNPLCDKARAVFGLGPHKRS